MKEDVLRLVIDDYRRLRGKQTAQVQLWEGDTIIWGQRVRNAEDEAEFTAIVEELGRRGVSAPADALRARFAEADQAVEAAGYGPAQPHQFDGVGRWHIDQLAESGRFLRTTDGAGYYFNGVTREPINVDDSAMELLLTQKFDRYPDESAMKHTQVMISAHARLFGDEVRLLKHSFYDQATNVLWLDLGDGKLLKVTADGQPEVLDNGSEGQMFKPNTLHGPWTYKADHRRLMRQGFIDRLSFATADDVPFTPEEQRLLFYLMMLSIWFRAPMRARPIIMAYGEKGSGKTTALEQAGQILFGPDFATMPPPGKDDKRDFETALVNGTFVIVDNLDNYVSWLEDLLASVATGSRVTRRVLYANMEEATYAPDVLVGITTREPKHRRDDMADRSIFFLFKPFGENMTRDLDEMYRWIVESRDDLVSEMVDFARDILAVDQPSGDGLNYRMTGFALFVIRAARAMDAKVGRGELQAPAKSETWEVVIMRILDRQAGYQVEFASEEDPLLILLPIWCQETNAEGVERWRTEPTSTELFKQLENLADRSGVEFRIKSAQALTSYIKSRRSLLEHEFVIDGPTHRGGGRQRSGRFWRIRPVGFDDPAAETLV